MVRSLFLMVLMFSGITFPFSQEILAMSSGRHTLRTRIRASGLLQSPVYNLTFTNPDGTIVIREINVELGQHVKKGTVLARLDPTLYQRSVDAARHRVVAAKHSVYVHWRRFVRGIQFVRALVHEAKVMFATSKKVLRATIRHAEALVNEAEAALVSDQRVLAATQEQAEAQIRAAEAQLVQSIATCRATSPTVPPAPSVPPAATVIPPASVPPAAIVTLPATVTPTTPLTGTLAVFSTNGTPASPSQDKSENNLIGRKQFDPVSTCIRAAQAQYQQAVAEARTPVVAAQAQVTKDQAALARAIAEARLEVVTAKKLVKDARAHIPVAVFDTDPFVGARELAEAELRLVEAIEDFRTARLNLLIGTVLIAPHDGVVTAINGTVGGVPGVHVNIAPAGLGSADSGVFIQLVDLSHVDRLLLNVKEADIVKVKVGQKVQFTLKAYPGRRFSGTVRAISPNGVVVNGAMTFPVIVRIDRKSTKGVKLFPNMTATATIATG